MWDKSDIDLTSCSIALIHYENPAYISDGEVFVL